jgi:hypothetical protein
MILIGYKNVLFLYITIASSIWIVVDSISSPNFVIAKTASINGIGASSRLHTDSNILSIMSWTLLTPQKFRVPVFSSDLPDYEPFITGKFNNITRTSACIVKYYGVALEYIAANVTSPVEYFGNGIMKTNNSSVGECFYITNKGFLSDKKV